MKCEKCSGDVDELDVVFHQHAEKCVQTQVENRKRDMAIEKADKSFDKWFEKCGVLQTLNEILEFDLAKAKSKLVVYERKDAMSECKFVIREIMPNRMVWDCVIHSRPESDCLRAEVERLTRELESAVNLQRLYMARNESLEAKLTAVTHKLDEALDKLEIALGEIKPAYDRIAVYKTAVEAARDYRADDKQEHALTGANGGAVHHVHEVRRTIVDKASE